MLFRLLHAKGTNPRDLCYNETVSKLYVKRMAGVAAAMDSSFVALRLAYPYSDLTITVPRKLVNLDATKRHVSRFVSIWVV